MLWRLDRDWAQAGDVRTATATIVSFRSSGEFVELHAWVVERSDSTVYIVSDRARVAAVGKWTREDDVVTASRDRVTPQGKNFCSAPPLTFRITATSVIGNVGGAGEGAYSPVTRLVIPEFETYMSEARHLCKKRVSTTETQRHRGSTESSALLRACCGFSHDHRVKRDRPLLQQAVLHVDEALEAAVKVRG